MEGIAGCHSDAVGSFLDKVLELTNSETDNERKAAIVQKLCDVAQDNSRLRTELYSQLVKQTESNDHSRKIKNAWKLFGKIVKNIPCSRVCIDVLF